ncbi:hypothetical protein Tco_0393270 [Tanacetum coccineum]
MFVFERKIDQTIASTSKLAIECSELQLHLNLGGTVLGAIREPCSGLSAIGTTGGAGHFGHWFLVLMVNKRPGGL